MNIERLLADRELAGRLRESGLERVREFGWEKAIENYKETYGKLDD